MPTSDWLQGKFLTLMVINGLVGRTHQALMYSWEFLPTYVATLEEGLTELVEVHRGANQIHARWSVALGGGGGGAPGRSASQAKNFVAARGVTHRAPCIRHAHRIR